MYIRLKMQHVRNKFKLFSILETFNGINHDDIHNRVNTECDFVIRKRLYSNKLYHRLYVLVLCEFTYWPNDIDASMSCDIFFSALNIYVTNTRKRRAEMFINDEINDEFESTFIERIKMLRDVDHICIDQMNTLTDCCVFDSFSEREKGFIQINE